MNQTTLVSGGVHGWNAAGLVRVCRALTAPLYRGPKALHKPAQGKRGTSAVLDFAYKKDKALKGRDNSCAAPSGLCSFLAQIPGRRPHQTRPCPGLACVGPLARSSPPRPK